MIYLFVDPKNKINKQNRNRLIDTENKLKISRWGRMGQLGEKGERIKKYKLVDTK